MATHRTSPDPDQTGMPGGIPYIVGNETAERFSFYGMRGILYVFLTGHLMDAAGQPDLMDKTEAYVWYHNFVAAAYLFPIVGAVLSDWLLGKYRTILYLSLVYCAGHAVMALVDYPALIQLAPRTTLFLALALIAVGTGGIKPCVSAHVGDQFGPANKHLLPKVFNWFYFAINLGSAASYLIIPRLLENFGPGVAFGVPGVLMAIATLLFWLGRKEFVHVPASGNALWQTLLSAQGLRAVGNLVPIYLFIIPFWMLFDQTSSAWVEQAKSLDRSIFGFELNPAESQFTNPVLVMLLIPLFSFVVYPAIDRFWKLTPLRKIGIGMTLTGLSFVAPALMQRAIDGGATPHIVWQLLAYAVITAGEVMVSVTVLEFSYTQAPRQIKSFIMGLYLLSVFAANKLVAYVNEYILAQQERGLTVLEGENYYWFFVGVMLATTVLFMVWAPFYRGQTYLQGDKAAHAEAADEPH